MRKIFFLSLLAAVMMSCSEKAETAPGGSGAGSEADPTPADAISFVQTLGMGWNLGNNLDAHSNGISNETCWGNGKATQATFDAVAKAGFRSVRIPTTWMGHIGAAPTYTIETAWMDRVAEVVGYAHKAGLKVILNIHHDGHADGGKAGAHSWLNIEDAVRDQARNAQIKAQLSGMWTQIAERFKDEGEWLIFETLNEIHDGNWGNEQKMYNPQRQYEVLDEWNQTAVDAIRATGGQNATRYIGVPSYVTQPYKAVEHLTLPTDQAEDRLLVAVHSYDPWDYAGSGKYSEWGHTGKDVVPDKAGEKEYVAMLDALYNKFVKQGVPVYFGEFACVHRSAARAEAFRKYYLEYVCKAMRDRQMTGFYWDNGYTRNSQGTDDDVFGLIDHATGAYLLDGKEVCDIMVSAWENNDPDYTLDSVYNKAP